jgi:hypothetical protein
MAKALLQIGRGFWNIRGSFTFCCGLVDIQTHMSVIRLPSGKFLIIDTIQITPQIKQEIDELTDNGSLIEAVLATHPFHTIYFTPFYEAYPHAKYYGTPRHIRNIPIQWEGTLSDPNSLQQWESQGIFMRIPAGADFESPAEDNHFSSIFVYHSESKTIHVDDTIQYFDHPDWVLRLLGKSHGRMEFWNPKKGLQHTGEAPLLFKAWIEQITQDWDFENICTAHCGNKIGGGKEQLIETIRENTPLFENLSREWGGSAAATTAAGGGSNSTKPLL